MHACVHTGRHQRTTYRSQFSPFTTWVSEINLKSPGLVTSILNY